MSIKTPLFYDFFQINRRKRLLKVNFSMIDINNIFHKIFVLCNLNLWFKSYEKSSEVPLNLFDLVTKDPVWAVD